MGIFDKKYCSVCGHEAKLLSRIKLSCGSCLCGSCAKIIPYYMVDSVMEYYTLSDYMSLRDYKKYSDQYLRPKFQESCCYYDVHLDVNNKLFYIGSDIQDQTIFLNLHNVTAFDLVYNGEEYKDGFLNEYVTGELLMEVEMENPSFRYETKLDSSAKAPAKKVLFGSKIEYGYPKGMEEFLQIFINNCIESREDDEEYDRSDEETSVITSDLHRAMALFMIDKIEDITLERIKTQRNRLIKTFHPDKGSADDTEYAQKINNAYEILKIHITQ